MTAALQAEERCIATGQWLDPNKNVLVDDEAALARMLTSKIILLGEHHQNPNHHQWHLEWLQRLNGEIENLELAVEMLPVQSQPIIDQWLRNEITDQEFILRSEWDEYWNHDINLYLPVLKFAKESNIPLHAINVSKQLFKDVSLQGWAQIPLEKREGVSNPGPASRPYLIQLARSFRRHGAPSGAAISREEADRFKRFIEVQLLWDRAMAEGIARLRQQAHAPAVVAMMGSGHMMHGFGTPYQLRDMELTEMLILVPWDDHLDCQDITPDFADLVYGSPPNLE